MLIIFVRISGGRVSKEGLTEMDDYTEVSFCSIPDVPVWGTVRDAWSESVAMSVLKEVLCLSSLSEDAA